MKRILRAPMITLLIVAMLLTMVPAYAADEDSAAYGQRMTSHTTQLNEGTTLDTGAYWSTYYAGARQETYVTYSPNSAVTPVVTYGGSVTARQTASSAAAELEDLGYRVVAGVNGDFFDSNGVPTGILVSGGYLLSSDGGNYAVGFRADGSAVIGRPALRLQGSSDWAGDVTLSGFNKARSSSGGIYAYTAEFKSTHDIGTTDPGVDVILEVISPAEAAGGRPGETPETACPLVGGTTYYRVVSVVENTEGTRTVVGENQLVLSANAAAAESYLTYLRSLQEGDIFSLAVTAGDARWNDVTEAVGALYPLVENGELCSGLDRTNAPRTAVGVKANGDVVLYTVDGRQSGYSVGSSQSVLAERMQELGCVTAVSFDGGGSTTAVATMPDSTQAQRLNRPSDGSERRVTDHLFLVASSQPTGRPASLYLSADSEYVLSGSSVEIAATMVDTNYIPMAAEQVELSASAGSIQDHTFTAPAAGGNVTITARSGSAEGYLTLTVVDQPDSVGIYRGTSQLTSLTVEPGEQVDLTAQAVYRRLPVPGSDDAFAWSVTGEIGTIDAQGVFTAASRPGSGTITVTKGRSTVSLPVTITTRALETLEDFEGDVSGYTGYQATVSKAAGQNVRFGSGALRLDYQLTGESAGLSLNMDMGSGFDRLTFWVYGDNSGNTLYLYDGSGAATPLVTLAFTGWQQVSVALPEGTERLSAILITGYTPGGTLYFDQFIASYGDVVDNTAPVLSGSITGTALTASAIDAVDGALPAGRLSLTCDGREVAFTVDAAGTVTADLSASLADGAAHRVSLTAGDASGNLARMSWDVAATAQTAAPFGDLTTASGASHWAASYFTTLYQTGVITGVADNGAVYARPDRAMTRAEFAVMLMRWMGLSEADYADVQLPFADAGEIASWALPAARAMYALGIMTGNGGADGTVTFDAASTVTRAQAVTMLGRIQEKGYASADLSAFPDSADVPSWARSYLETLYAQGVLAGSDGRLNPNGAMTRGQACKILYMMW